MSRLICIKYENKEGRELLVEKVEVLKDGGIKGAYKKGKEVLDCVICFDEEINPNGLCSRRFKYNLLFDEVVNLNKGQKFKIGDIEFLVLRNKECFSECELVKQKYYCSLRNVVFVRALESGIIKVGDEIKK
jgi:hypothetical protein